MTTSNERSCLGEQNREMKEYPNAASYVDEVRRWIYASQCWNFCHQMAWMHSYTYITMNANTILPSPSPVVAGNQPVVHRAIRTTARFTQRQRIPSFPHRVAAECIDAILAFIIRLCFICYLVKFEYISIDDYDFLASDLIDIRSLIAAAQEIFPVELLGKIIISFVEALFLAYGCGSIPPGTTPGKYLMSLQVISCYEISSLGGDECEVNRTQNLSFRNAFFRSLLKNMIINSLFPLSAIAYAFNFNRAVYDLMADTVVVCL